METGTQALSYKGNADLGYGADGMPLVNDDASLQNLTNNINSMLGNLSTQSQQWNMNRYAQAIKDRDTSMQIFADQDIDQPVSDEDRKILETKLNGMHDFMLKNPQIGSDIKTYQQAQQLKNEFRGLKASAQARQVQFAKLRQDTANELDPSVRDDMQRHLDEQTGTGITHEVTPYFKQVDPTKTLFSYTPETKDLGIAYDGNGLAFKQNQMDFDKMNNYYSLQTAMKNPAWLQDVNFFYNQAKDHPEANNELYAATNLKLGKINSELGLQPSDPRYLQPVATKNDDGSYKVTGDPLQYVKGLAFASKYDSSINKVYDKEIQGGLKTVADVKHTAAETSLTNAQANTEKYRPGLIRAQAANANADAGLASANAEKAKAEAEKIRKEAELLGGNDQEANSAIAISDRIFNSAATNGTFQPATPENLYKVISSTGVPINMSQAPIAYKSLGINKDWLISTVPKDEAAVSMLSTAPSIDPVTKKAGPPVKPKAIFMARNPRTGEEKLIGLDADGKLQKVLPRDEGAHAVLDNELQYRNDSKTIKLHDQIEKVHAARGTSTQSAPAQTTTAKAPDLTGYEPLNVSVKGGKTVQVYRKDGKVYRMVNGELKEVKRN